MTMIAPNAPASVFYRCCADALVDFGDASDWRLSLADSRENAARDYVTALLKEGDDFDAINVRVRLETEPIADAQSFSVAVERATNLRVEPSSGPSRPPLFARLADALRQMTDDAEHFRDHDLDGPDDLDEAVSRVRLARALIEEASAPEPKGGAA